MSIRETLGRLRTQYHNLEPGLTYKSRTQLNHSMPLSFLKAALERLPELDRQAAILQRYPGAGDIQHVTREYGRALDLAIRSYEALATPTPAPAPSTAPAAYHAPAGAVKSLDNDRLMVRGIVWGGADLVGDTFVRGLTDLGASRRGFAGMPVFWDHAQGSIKSQIGTVIAAFEDDEGINFEVELDRAKAYARDVMRLAKEGVLKASTGALSHLVERRGGELVRWIVGELSLVVTAAEPRTSAVPL